MALAEMDASKPAPESKNVLLERLLCIRKTIGKRRGAAVACLTFQRVTGGPRINVVVPEADAAGITVGGFYRRAIVPDTDSAPESSELKPGRPSALFEVSGPE